MGLDSYLYVKIYVGLSQLGNVISKMFPEMAKVGVEVKEVTFQICYWRKNWVIHNWFVNKCQNGEDDCRNAYVDFDVAKDLYYRIKQILKPKGKPERIELVKKLLNGNEDDCDQWFFEDLKKTKNALQLFFDEYENHFFELEYSSSW
jgi:hypothetical protein